VFLRKTGAITEQILRLFSLAERHTLLRDAKPVQFFPPQLTELQRQTLDLLGVPDAPSWPDSPTEIHALLSTGSAECKTGPQRELP
jgi:hypothetical protein